MHPPATLRPHLLPCLGSLFAVGIATSVILTGCEDDTKSEAQDFVTQYCALLTPCCAEAGMSADPSGCTLLLGMALTGGNYDPSRGSACLDALRQASQNGTVCPADNAPSANTCEEVFRLGSPGTAAPGQPCEAASDCAAPAGGDAMCLDDKTPGSTVRTCTAEVVGKEGDAPCIGIRDGLLTMYSGPWKGKAPELGYVCDQALGLTCDAASGACKALARPGDPCQSSFGNECVSSAWCNTSEKLCEARVGAGASCLRSSSECDSKSYCDPNDLCVARVANGQPCTSPEQCESNTCINQVCRRHADIGTAFLCSE